MKIFLILISLLLLSCNAKEISVYENKNQLETITFDVVQKNLIIETDLPTHLDLSISKWFNNNIKIDGFNGDLFFTIYDFSQNIFNIDNGKKVEASISFKVLINKENFSKTKIIEGKINSFGTLTGSFSLDDFDVVIKNTQNDLILRLSRDLASKI